MPFDFRYWQWLFKANPAGSGYVWLAEDDGILTGQYAIIPTRMQVQGKPIRCAQALGAMTRPSYRKQKIFTKLAQAVFEATGSGEVDLVYGFPNDRSAHGHLKHLDFFVLENLITWVRPLDIAGILNVNIGSQVISKVLGKSFQAIFNTFYSRHIGSDTNVRIESTSEFPNEVDILFRACAPKFQNLVIRDHQYLKWRYEDHPAYAYRIFLGYRGNALQGYCVCGSTIRKGIKIGLIVDLFTDPDDHQMVTDLIRCAVRHMEAEKMMLGACILTSASPFLNPLKSQGFFFPSRRFPYILRINSNELDPSSLRNVKDWHITFGDADFV